jgi:transketolase
MNKFELQGKKPTRHGFGQALAELGEKHNNLVVLGSDITGSVMTSYFKEKFPERFFSLGIAEQNATTVAVGMALSGKIPIMASYSAFAAFRNTDQLRISVCYNNANVKIGGGHSGITVGPDGATHQSLEELSILRTLPNMTVVVPCDYLETRKATIALAEMVGPAYIRFGRSAVPMFTKEDTPFEIGKAQIFHEGNDVAIVACGLMVWEALLAADALEKENGISVRVINNSSIKPMDVETITEAARECGCMVTAEEHQVHGGMGSAVAEITAKNYPVPIEFIGIKDRFGESGEPEELQEKFGLTWKEIYKTALNVIERKKKPFIGYRKIIDF